MVPLSASRLIRDTGLTMLVWSIAVALALSFG